MVAPVLIRLPDVSALDGYTQFGMASGVHQEQLIVNQDSDVGLRRVHGSDGAGCVDRALLLENGKSVQHAPPASLAPGCIRALQQITACPRPSLEGVKRNSQREQPSPRAAPALPPAHT
jgi:hypothetical protein